MDELDRPTGVQPGACHACHRWTRAGIVVAVVHSDSGSGATVVACLACYYARRPRTGLPQRLAG
jgi:hypothetical protein